MKIRSISCAAFLASVFLYHAAPGRGSQAECEIPFRYQGHLIVVEASIGAMTGLRFMIDTGATGSVVDRKVVKALGLEQLPGESQIIALGQVAKAHRFHIPVLRIGPVFAVFDCREADLSGLGVDGIIGLDLLRQQIRLANCKTNEAVKGRSFAIDFKTRRLHFGIRQQLDHTVPLEAPNPQLIVVAMIKGHPLRLAVDTGSYTIVLFKEPQMRWLEPRVIHQRARLQMVGRLGGGKQVILPDMELGNSRWTNPGGILVDLPNEAKDGLLSVKQLGLKILHFDFERNLMSWKK